jgi:hypothetical protein
MDNSCARPSKVSPSTIEAISTSEMHPTKRYHEKYYYFKFQGFSSLNYRQSETKKNKPYKDATSMHTKSKKIMSSVRLELTTFGWPIPLPGLSYLRI